MSRRYLFVRRIDARRALFPKTRINNCIAQNDRTLANLRQLPPTPANSRRDSSPLNLTPRSSTLTIFQSITLVVATTQHQHQHLLEDSSLRSQPKKQCGESVKVLTNAIGIYLGPQVDLIRRGIQSQMHSRFIALPKPMIHLNISQGVLLP